MSVCDAFIPSGLAVDRQWACALLCSGVSQVFLEFSLLCDNNKEVKKSSETLVLLFSYP